jgi:hypothetical protein
MIDQTSVIVAPLARWSSRIALFAASLMLVGVALHWLASFPTPVAVNLFRVALAGAGLAMLTGMIALVQIWRRGYAGARNAALGILLPLAFLAWPLTYLPAYFRQPPINDVTTDLAAPPRFAVLAAKRTGVANSAAYPGERFAELQQKAYPDLRTVSVDRSVDETFELIEETVRKLRWKVAASDPPAARPPKGGTLEATDQTLLLGFPDDVVIRIEGNANRSRIDVRSASRYGTVDFGQNATRVRRFFGELQARLDSTAPTSVAGRRVRGTRAGALVKRVKERDPPKADRRNARDRGPSSAQRARGQKETPR